MSIAAIPETYAIAWTCLLRNIEITKGQSKGGTRDIERQYRVRRPLIRG